MRHRAGRVVGVGESLGELSKRIGTADPRTLSVVFEDWPATAGDQISRHSRPERIVAGTLYVSADSPAWASRLKTVAPNLLARIRQLEGAEAPSRVVVRVRRTK